MAAAGRGGARALVRLVLLALALFGLSRLVDRQDVAAAWRLIEQTGWPLALVLLPTMVAMGLDAAGWRTILAALGSAIPWRRLFGLRVSVEALVLLLPGGSVAGEAAKAALLARQAGVPLPRAVASQALTKGYLLVTDAAYLAIAAFWAIADRRLAASTAWWPALGAAVAAIPVGVAGLLLLAALGRAGVASRLAATLSRFPSARFRRFLADRQQGFAEIDASAGAFFAAPRQGRQLAFACFLAEWLVEGLETILIVRFLNIPLTVGSILVLDALGSLLRVIVFFLPAGLGAQDAAILLLLRAMGVPDPIASGAALVLVKRAKEMFWVGVGGLVATTRSDRFDNGTGCLREPPQSQVSK